VFVADAGVVKLLGGEDSGLARPLHDVRQGGYLGFGGQDKRLGRVGRGSQGRISFYA
jgi:hypothetical protein